MSRDLVKEAYEAGKREGELIGIMTRYSVNDLREIFGVPRIKDGYRPEVVIEDETVVETEKVADPVNHPSYYADGKIEVIDFIEDKKLGFCLGNAVKYIARAGKKDSTKELEDLAKARWYIDRRMYEVEEGLK